MQADKAKHARQTAKYISYKLQQFDVNEYVGNTTMIKNIYTEKLEAQAEIRELREQLEVSRESYHSLELDKQKLELKLDEANHKLEDASQRSFLQFLLTVVAAVILGFGVNITTSAPSGWIGWLLVIFAVILEVVAFLITFLPGHFFTHAGRGN